MPLYATPRSFPLPLIESQLTLISHLLGKKSWNVYNADNVARVRRDEEAAAAAERAAEQRMQDADAARRLAILRGETPPPLPEPEPEIDPSDNKTFARQDRDSNSATGFMPRKRKRAGEDDTDFEMRLVRERGEVAKKVAGELALKQPETAIVGRDGHIDLVGAGAPEPATGKEKNPEYEREAAKKKRELEDQYKMRFSNAAGRDGFAAGDPWYAKSDSRRATAATATNEGLEAEIGLEAPTKDVWGNDDPKRRARETQRLISSDPLAMMKMGAKKVREIEKERKKEIGEREKELEDLRREERRREKRHKKEKYEGEDESRGNRDHHKHRSHRSEHSRRRHVDDGRKERVHSHRHRDDVRDTRRDRDQPKSLDRDKERDRDRSSRPHRDSEDRHQYRRRQQDGIDHER